MKIWVDDIRHAPDTPEGYIWYCSVNETIRGIEFIEFLFGNKKIELIDLDHDAGDYYSDGGDYIKILDWLEETGRNYPIRIHSMNPVGIENMRSIIQRNHWKEVV